jgi:hypothetical protein
MMHITRLGDVHHDHVLREFRADDAMLLAGATNDVRHDRHDARAPADDHICAGRRRTC